MSREVFVDREGKQITKSEWLLKDETYADIRLYDNGSVRVCLKWVGHVSAKDAQALKDYWPVYVIRVQNYNSYGDLIDDPVDDDDTFPNETDALAGYVKFLIKWTESAINYSTGELIEKGNIYTPPVPPDPNKPETESALEGGAW